MLDGRDFEIERGLVALDESATESRRLEIIGEPGIGKTAVFDEVVEQARQRGARVLVARPTEAESAIAYATLGDLIDAVVDEVRLPEPQQRAVDIALGRVLDDGVPVAARTLGAGVAAILAALAERGPTVVAVDDVQWADASSAEVLAFVSRRLPRSGLLVLSAHRPVIDPLYTDGERLVLGPLPPDATARIARQRASRHVPAALIDRIVESSGGSPLYAIEMVRTLTPANLRAIVPLPVPASLDQLVADRVRALPAPTIDALASAALLAAPTVDALAALGVLDDLRPAEEARIVEIDGRDVRFAHPLLAAAAHDAIPGSQRLRMHRRLADVTTGLERCVHLALGTDHADRVVAVELSDAVPRLVARGAITEAADLAVLALSITPTDDPSRHELMLTCGDTLFRAGRTDEALAHLERARAESTAPELRARALLGLATIEYSHTDNAERAIDLATQALELTVDPGRRAEAHTILARVLYTDFPAAADNAAEALRLLEQINSTDGLELAMALTASAGANFLAGRGLDHSMFERAIELERGSAVSAADSAAGALAALLKYADDLDGARAMLMSLIDDADEGSLPYVLGHLPQLELWTGRWDEADKAARRQLELARRTEQESQVQGALFNLAMCAAFRGDVDDARPAAQALFDEGRRTGALWTERNGAGLLGFLAMSVGDAATAVERLGRYDDLGEAIGLFEPGYTRFHGDFVEALVAVGDLDRAVEVLDRIEPRAIRLHRPSAIGSARRGRALVAAHAGNVDVAITSARAALEAYEGTSLVYDRARAYLTLGVVLRRFKLKAEARTALIEAQQLFEMMGARSFVERVRLELGRLGVRVDAPLSLTETETQVAQLAAGGRTTKQIADALFISTKTVEANMTRIYRKLGVANRAELANLLANGTPT